MVKVQNVNECYFCSCWDSERYCCTMPSVDKIYACPLYINQEDLKEEKDVRKNR